MQLMAYGVLAVAAGLTTALLRPQSTLDAAITFGVVAATGSAGAVLATGAPGVLTPAAILAVTAAWAILAGAARARRAGHLGVALPRLQPREHPWTAAVLALAVAALAWQLLVALILPPFAFDALTYHLTIVSSWIQAENINPSSLSLCCAYYPANSELLFTWPMLFAGGDRVVDLTQFGFVALSAAAVAGIARSAGLTRPAAAAAALFTLTPIVLLQAPTNYADVIVAACALAGLHAMIRFAVTGAWQRLLVAGLAAGLLLGTKGTGVVWGAVLAVMALGVGAWLVRSRRLPVRATAWALAGFLAGLLALGSYWYARNWIEQGNPAYPFEVSVAGAEVFEGPLRVGDVLTEPDTGGGDPWPVATVRSWASDLDFWTQADYDYQQRSGGLGPLWPWLALPLLVPLAIGLIRRRSPALLALGAVGVVLLIQPYAWWSRFTIPLMALGAIAIAAAVAWAPRRWMRVAVQALALVLAVAGVALASHEVNPSARADPLPAKDLLSLTGESDEERSIGQLFFPEYRFLEGVPDTATVIVDLPAEPVRFVYPLFGPKLDRTVVPAGSGAPPPDAWVVTGSGRPLDRALAGMPGFTLAADEADVRVWRPR